MRTYSYNNYLLISLGLRYFGLQWERAFVWRDSAIISIYDKTVLPPQQVAQPPNGFCCC